MITDEAIHKLQFSIDSYRNLQENDTKSGTVLGKDIEGNWSSETTLYDLYQDMIDALEMGISALKRQKKYRKEAKRYKRKYLREREMLNYVYAQIEEYFGQPCHYSDEMWEIMKTEDNLEYCREKCENKMYGDCWRRFFETKKEVKENERR